jgi:hypothetical protein
MQRARCREMSTHVQQCRGVLPYQPSRHLRGDVSPSSDDREYVALPDQHAPAGRAVNGDLAGHQPSINCPNSHAAQESDLSFRQKLLVIGSIHDVIFPSALRAHASAIRAKRPPAVIEYVYYNPKDLPHTPINGPMIQVFVYAFNQKKYDRLQVFRSACE